MPARRATLALVALLTAPVARAVPDAAPADAPGAPPPAVLERANDAPTPLADREAPPQYRPRETEFELPEPQGQATVVLVEIKGPIDLGLAPFLRRVLRDAANRPDVVAVISEIDTPGGRVDAAVQIRDALLESKVPTVAWVHRQAISAGALIAYAHRYIVFSTGGAMGAATPITLGPGGQAHEVGEKIVSYMRGVMRATAEAQGRDGRLAEAMVDADVEIPGITPKGKLVTLTDEEAIRWGVADGKADTLDAVLDLLGASGARIERPTINWAERLARVLTGPVVSSLLMSLGMLGLFVELMTPGFGVAGIIGLTCLALFFFGHWVVHLAGLEEIALLAVGLALLIAEIFFIPGFGIAGILGIACIVAALALMLVGLPIDVSWNAGLFERALVRVALSLLATGVAAFIVLRFLPHTRLGSRLVLAGAVRGAAGHAVEQRGAVEAPGLTGRTGRAVTPLRPSGKALIDGRWVDVVSEGDWVEPGTPVEVVAVEGMRIVVRPVTPQPAAAASDPDASPDAEGRQEDDA